MIIYNTALIYHVCGTSIELFLNETAYGWSVVAEVNNLYHYLGDQLANLHTAINLWQQINNKVLSQEEFELVLIENGTKSQAV
jgi:hypothetical protein